MEGKSQLNWRRILITGIFVLLSAVIVGGTTWYIMDRNASDIRLSNDKVVSELQKQIDKLKEKKPEVATVVTIKNDISSWSKFTSTVNGYSFRYPDAQYTVGSSAVTIPQIEGEILSSKKEVGNYGNAPLAYFDYYFKDIGHDLKYWITEEKTSVNYVSDLQAVTIAGRSGYSFKSAGMSDEVSYAFTDSKGNVLVITTTAPATDAFKQILETITLS